MFWESPQLNLTVVLRVRREHLSGLEDGVGI